jgi:hypothetical protein
VGRIGARCRVDVVGVECASCTLAVLTFPRSGHVERKLKDEFLSGVDVAEIEGTGAWVHRSDLAEIGVRWIGDVPIQRVEQEVVHLHEIGPP